MPVEWARLGRIETSSVTWCGFDTAAGGPLNPQFDQFL